MTPPSPEEMKQHALLFLEHLNGLRAAGGGTLAAAEVFDLVGTPSDAELVRQLEGRGELVLEFQPDGKGTFRNSGSSFSIPAGPIKLVVPTELTGTVACSETAAALNFHPAHTLVAKVLFMDVKLERIEVSEHHLAVRLPGGVFDKEYYF